MNNDQRIGILIRNGKSIFYATLDGQQVETESLVGMLEYLKGYDIQNAQ